MAETHSHYMSTILAFYEISYEQKKKKDLIKNIFRGYLFSRRNG